MKTEKAIIKMQAVIVVAIIIIAAVAGSLYYYYTLPTDVKTIRILSGFSKPEEVESIGGLIEEYEETHSNVNIDYQLGPWGDHISLFVSAKAAGMPPDIICTNSENVVQLMAEGEIVPVDDVIQQLDEKYAGGENYFDPAVLEQLDPLNTGDYWHVPTHGGTMQLTVRADLFEEKGLEYPKTFADVLECAEALTEDLDGDGTIDRYGFGFPLGRTYATALFAMNLLWLNGATMLDENGDLVIDSPEAIEALEFLRELYQYMPPDVTEWGWPELREGLWKDRVAMLIYPGLTDIDEAYMRNKEIAMKCNRTLLMIGPSGSEPWGRAFLNGWVITNGSEVHDEAVEFLTWIYKPERWIKVVLGHPLWLIPLSPINFNLPEYQNNEVVKDLHAITEFVLEKGAKWGRFAEMENPGIYNADSPKILYSLIFTDAIQEMIINDVPASEALAKYRPELEDLIGG